MESRREYYRTFIILKQDTRGYSFANKEPSGYCKIDAYGNKAKIQVYVQDLKPIPKEKGYKVFLLANLPTGPRKVPIESFYVDEKGKRDIKFEVNRNNVGESGLAIEQFEGVAILIEDSSSPLVGFKKESFVWKNTKSNLQDMEEKIEKEEKKEIKDAREKEEKVEKVEEKEEVQKVEAVEEKEEVQKVEAVEEKEEVQKVEAVEEKEEVQEAEATEETNVTQKVKEIEEIISYFTPDSYGDFPRSRPKKEDYLSKILRENTKMNPFEKVNEDMEWYRISYEELPLILEYPWRWYSNPYLLVGAKKYNHLLLGKNIHLNTYYLGIPDIYFPNAKERAKAFGFHSFLCCRNIKPTSGEYGYWIMELPSVNFEK